MAEAVLKHQISERASLKGKYDFKIDSAGTGAYHAGDSADERYVLLFGLPGGVGGVQCQARLGEGRSRDQPGIWGRLDVATRTMTRET